MTNGDRYDERPRRKPAKRGDRRLAPRIRKGEGIFWVIQVNLTPIAQAVLAASAGEQGYPTAPRLSRALGLNQIGRRREDAQDIIIRRGRGRIHGRDWPWRGSGRSVPDRRRAACAGL